MKKISIIASLMLLAGASYLYFSPSEAELKAESRAAYADYISNHEFSQREHMAKAELKKIPKKDRPDLAAELDFLLTMDPALKRPAPERITEFLRNKALNNTNSQAKAMAQPPGSETFPWEDRGPNNVAGRTRAMMFDPNDSTYAKVWAGGVSGGLWYNDNIYSATSEWHGVSQLWENIPISAICADPQDSQVFYVGTGEGFGGRSTVGAGIWKSSDAGTTWTLLPSTTDYKIINDLIVREEGDTSALYVASDRMGGYNGASFGDRGIFRSTDGGTTFTEIEANGSSLHSPSDFELGVDNTLWIATVGAGAKIYSLADTVNATLDQKNTLLGGDRVEIATAPSDSNYVYAIIESATKVGKIIRTTDHGTTWESLSEPNDIDNGIDADDFSRGQAWYDLIIQVDPNDKEVIIAGAVDLFRSANGGTSWSQISHWWGYVYPEVHADQHNILFKPGSSDTCLFTNDGGVYYTNELSYPNPSFSARNKEYNVTQFYSCDLHPDSLSNNYIAGAQDNGTQKFTSAGMNATEEIYGGDGAYCFIDQQDGDTYIASYTYANYYISNNSGNNWNGLLNKDEGAYFINPAGYDSKVGMLYATRTAGDIFRASTSGVDTMYISGMAKSTHFSISPYGDEDTSNIFIGTVNGQIYKVENASDSTFTFSEISGNAMPSGSVSCIAIGSSDDELLATFSNYGVNSVWYTNNGGDNWTNVEGDLPDMPVRWALFNPANWGEVILATELGIWATPSIQLPTVEWTQSINGIENVRVNMLRTRPSDNQVVAATYGRGLFTSNGFNEAYAPVAIAVATDTTLCIGQQTQLKDISSYIVDEREWIITPNSGFEYMYATDSASQYPTVKFTEEGDYTIKLVVNNSNGSDSVILEDYIIVLDMAGSIIHTNSGPDELKASIDGASYQWIKNGFNINGATDQTYYPTENATYRVEIELEGYCKKKSPSYNLENLDLEDQDLSSLDLWFSKNLESIILSGSEGYDFSNCQMTVSDTQGRLVFNGEIEETEISMSHLKAGIYIALITKGEKQIAHTKFVIQ